MDEGNSPKRGPVASFEKKEQTLVSAANFKELVGKSLSAVSLAFAAGSELLLFSQAWRVAWLLSRSFHKTPGPPPGLDCIRFADWGKRIQGIGWQLCVSLFLGQVLFFDRRTKSGPNKVLLCSVTLGIIMYVTVVWTMCWLANTAKGTTNQHSLAIMENILSVATRIEERNATQSYAMLVFGPSSDCRHVFSIVTSV